jgi:hypothetical protein
VSARPEQTARCAVKRGDVFFTPSSEMPFDVAVSAIAMEDIADAAYSYHVVRLRLQRREKTRDLKQALMQELLTGRTRLI